VTGITLTFLATSLLIGASHAFEPDHLAAVGSMATEQSGRRHLVLRGALWGVGHTIALFLLSMAAVGFGMALSIKTQAVLELTVGLMLVGLGLQGIARALNVRMHNHSHSHGNDGEHKHLHVHIANDDNHSSGNIGHVHLPRFDLKPLAVGMVHGAAGSGALVVTMAAISENPLAAGAYVAVFGIGSILGMAAFSLFASWPLTLAFTNARKVHVGLTVSIGLFATGLGARIVATNFAAM
jgi:sulfite exporter TauE/SafE